MWQVRTQNTKANSSGRFKRANTNTVHIATASVAALHSDSPNSPLRSRDRRSAGQSSALSPITLFARHCSRGSAHVAALM